MQAKSDTQGKTETKSQGVEKHFQEMRQKVHDYIEQHKMDHTIKKLLKKDPVAVLLAADIGFVSEAEVQDYILWEISTN